MKRYYTIIILALASAFEATAQEAGGEDMLKDTLHAANIISDKNTFDNSTQTGLMRIDGSKFRTGYAVFNSPDVIKTLQMLPGVASGTELLSGFYVRGGTGSDNLFLLDGVPLYQVSHLGGLFSSFNADIVEGTDFYKSGFPARYGGRLSSVVDVTTAPGDMYEYHGSFSIGLIDGRLQYEGPIVKGKTSFNVSLRRSWLDVVATPALAIVNRKLKKEDNQTINAGFNFNDFNAGITHKFSDDNVLRVNFYRGRDRQNTKITDIENPYNPDTDSRDLDYEDISIIGGNMHWGNTLVSGVWKKNFSDRLSGQTSAWYSRYITSINLFTQSTEEHLGKKLTEMIADATNSTAIEDIAARSDWSYLASDSHHLRFGGHIKYKNYNPRNESLSTAFEEGFAIDTTSRILETNRYRAGETALYIEDEISLGKHFKGNVGLRYTGFLTKGKYLHALEPRVALKYQMGAETSLRLSYSEMTQYDHQVATSYIDLPTNIWMPSTPDIKGMKSRQVAMGLYSSVGKKLLWSVEGYWKTMTEIREYNGASMIYPPITSWEKDFVEGRGRSWGAEFSAEYAPGPRTSLTGYYTLSWSQRFFEDFYYDWYNDRCDNRHKITLMVNHKFNDRIDCYAGWNFHSGNSFTIATQAILKQEPYYAQWQHIYEKPNNIKMPAYHRADVGINFRKLRSSGVERVWNLSIYNAYSRINAIMATLGTKYDEKGHIVGWTTNALGVVPIIPTFSYGLNF